MPDNNTSEVWLRRVRRLALWMSPFIVLVVAAWSRRWIADDGFINLRIAQQWLAGRGPVLNPGERVEAGTSLLWPLMIAAADIILPLRIEYVSVVLSFVTMVTGLFVALVSSWNFSSTTYATRRLWPAGLLVFCALPPVWDFTTSGLEFPLTVLYLALCWRMLVRVHGGVTRKVGNAALLFSLGYIVRPDLIVVGFGFLVAALLIVAPNPRGISVGTATRLMARFSLLPVIITVLRAGFFATLLPNTALAKEAGGAYWSAGRAYFMDSMNTYMLWLPLVLLALGIAGAWSRTTGPDRPRFRSMVVIFAPVVCGVVNILWVVRVGGDFMHARMLLPGLFLVFIPVLTLPWTAGSQTIVEFGVVVGLVLWTLASVFVLRPQHGPWLSKWIADERMYYVKASGSRHPVTTDDVLPPGGTYDVGRLPRLWVAAGEAARQYADGGREVFIDANARLAIVDSPPVGAEPLVHAQIIDIDGIGLASFAAGPDVYVLDERGLADPIVARLEMGQRGRPGHEKSLPLGILAERVAPGWYPTGAVRVDATTLAEFRRLLTCAPITELQDAVSKPMSISRFVNNVRLSWRLTRLRIPRDTGLAVSRFCGGG